MKPQKVIITLTDNGDGKVGCTMDFKPSITADGPMSPAVRLAAEMVDVITTTNKFTMPPEVQP